MQTIEILFRTAREERFAQEPADIARDGQVKKNSRLKALSSLVCNGILRVGGWLRHTPFTYSQRHPMILPDRHPLTVLILKLVHLNNLHAGPRLTTAAVREVMEQLIGELTPERVTPTLAFSYRPAQQQRAPIKCYIAIFTCLVTKAICVECVQDLSTNAFIAALQRFVARRGLPKLIECNNALNFQGAKRELDQLVRLFGSQHHQHLVTSSCANDSIASKFILPRSPNFRDVREAAVEYLKNRLRTPENVILSQN